MNRRKFLKNVLGTGAAVSTCTLGNMLGISAAQASHFVGATAPTLVVIFQRGGCDGLNTVVPYGDAEYYKLRSSISIAAPSASNANAASKLLTYFPMILISDKGKIKGVVTRSDILQKAFF